MLNNGNDESSEKSKKKEAKRVSRKANRAVRQEKRGKTTSTAPDGSTATVKRDKKNRIKKVTYKNEMGKKYAVDRFTKTERQAEAQKKSGKYTEEDKPIVYPKADKSPKVKKATPRMKARGLGELSEEQKKKIIRNFGDDYKDPYSRVMKEDKKK